MAKDHDAVSPLYLGFDLSTQQLKGIVVDSGLNHQYQARVDFDGDCADVYHVEKGTLSRPEEGKVYAPVAMWLKAIDLLLSRLKHQGLDFSRIACLSGAGMQHGSVFWSFEGERDLETLDPAKPLEGQLKDAFAWPYSPNWQDSSTQAECDAFDAELSGSGDGGGNSGISEKSRNDSVHQLARVTGSKAHHRFTGPQIMRLRKKHPDAYEKTARISLVSSWIASIFMGQIAPIDRSDVGGMNLWDIPNDAWNRKLLSLASGGDPDGLERKLHQPCAVEGIIGNISQYFVRRWGFSESCRIAPSTGDNPSTILSLPLQANDAIVSLGTSTTFLMSTSKYLPDPAYHFFNHPATKGLYLFMLCYKNGALAREIVRDSINVELNAPENSWDLFNSEATKGDVLGMKHKDDPVRISLFFPRPEIVPNVPAGTRRFAYNPVTKQLKKIVEHEIPGNLQTRQGKAAVSSGSDDDASIHESEADSTEATVPPGYFTHTDPRAILESQFLSLRLRSANLVTSSPSAGAASDGGADEQRKPGQQTNSPPPQPRRIFLVGGAAENPAVAELAGQILGGTEGVYRLQVGGNACALGAAYRAAWAVEGGGENAESFEDFLTHRWDEARFVQKIPGAGYTPGVYERYAVGVEALAAAEQHVIAESARKRK